MAEYYLGLRHAHIALALLSVTIFILRGGLMLADSPARHAPWLRYPSMLVDTLLLTAALLTVGFIFSVARAHHPLGIFANTAG